MPDLENHQATVTCATHGSGECWVVCEHAVPGKTLARKIAKQPVAGEVLCGECRVMADAERGADLNPALRVACGDCVREQFPMEGAI